MSRYNQTKKVSVCLTGRVVNCATVVGLTVTFPETSRLNPVAELGVGVSLCSFGRADRRAGLTSGCV